MKKILYMSFLFIFLLGGTTFAADISLQNLSVPTLMYHKVSDNPNDWNEYCISSAQLRSDFEEFKQAGFSAIGVSEYYALSNAYKEAVASPNNPAKTATFNELIEKYPNPLLITIDDGYDDGYTIVLPLLKEYNFKANFAIVGMYTKEQEPSAYLIPAEIKEMAESGYAEFGNHTNLLHDKEFYELQDLYDNKNNYSLIKEDYLANEEILTKILGKPSSYFSYPYGVHNWSTDKIIDEINVSVSLITNASPDFVKLSDSTKNISRYNRVPTITSKELVKTIIEKIMVQNPKVYRYSNSKLKDYYDKNYPSASTFSELIDKNKIPTNKFWGTTNKQQSPVVTPVTDIKPSITKVFYNSKTYEFETKFVNGTAVIYFDDLTKYKEITVYINPLTNSKKITFSDKEIMIVNNVAIYDGKDVRFPEMGNNYIPVKTFFETLGYTVEYFNTNNEIRVY